METSKSLDLRQTSASEATRPFPRSSRIILLLILLLSISLQSAAAAQKSFWEDEAYTAAVISRSDADLQQAVSSDVHPPLFLNLASAWGRVFGANELGLRALSILFAALTSWFVFLLARDLFDDRTALAATALLGLSPLFLMFANQARYYSLSAFFSVLIVFAMNRFHSTGRIRYLALYIAGAALYLYLVYTSVIVIAMCNLWFLILWSRDPVRKLSPLAVWIGAQTLAALAYLPVMVGLVQVTSRFSEKASVVNWPVELLKRLLYSGYVYLLGETLSPFNLLAWLGVTVMAFILIYALIRNRRRPSFWLAASFVAAILLGNLVVSMNSAVSLTWQNLPARNLNLLPFLAICLGAGFAGLRPKFALPLAALALAVYALAAWNFFTGQQYLRPTYAVPWRDVFSEIRLHAGPDAVVMCSQGDYACPYYQERFGYPERMASAWSSIQPEPAEVWWIQVNVGWGADYSTDQKVFTALQSAYSAVQTYSYAPQDERIRWAKSRWMGRDDYEYRVVVYQFQQR